MEMDPPEHTRYRRLVSKPFSRREVYAYEAAIRGLARLVIDEVATSGATTFDFVDAIAKQLPMRMLGRLLGVPDEDGPWLVERGDALLGNTDPDFTTHPVDLVDTEEFRLIPFRSPAGIDLFRYAEEQARQRRAHPTDDVISHLLAPMVDGDHLTDQEFNNFFTLLVAAGNDTTRYTMAQGMLALMEHPEQMAALRDGAIDMGTAVEEILRWGTVTMHFRRTATEDTELAGRAMPQRRQGGHLVHVGRLRRGAVPRPVPLRHPPHPQRPRRLRPPQPAPLPRRAAGPHGAEGAVRGAPTPPGRHPPRRAGRAAALQLHQRHQAPPRPGRLGLGAPAHPD